MLKMLKKILDEEGYISLIFIDLPKTFGTFNHELLIAKLGRSIWI